MIPSPLHPAIVHFPIVLVLVGTAVALGALFTARGHLRWFSAVLLTLGALGVLIAVNTGREDSEVLDHTVAINALLDGHESWAERTAWLSVFAAVFAIATIVATRWRVLAARVLAVLCAVTALGASFGVYQTGRRGGELVYRHAAGVASAPVAASSLAREDPD